MFTPTFGFQLPFVQAIWTPDSRFWILDSGFRSESMFHLCTRSSWTLDFWILDSGFWILIIIHPDSRKQSLDSWFLILDYGWSLNPSVHEVWTLWILDSGFWILDSALRNRIRPCTSNKVWTLDAGFFWILDPGFWVRMHPCARGQDSGIRLGCVLAQENKNRHERVWRV